MATPKPAPHTTTAWPKGTPLPLCQLCNTNRARYDARTKAGHWGYLCNRCFKVHGVGLGLGKGQRLVTK